MAARNLHKLRNKTKAEGGHKNEVQCKTKQVTTERQNSNEGE